MSVWIIGRIIYKNGYMAAPEKRSNGFLIAGLALVGLLICALVGIVMQLSATTVLILDLRSRLRGD